MTLLSNHIIVIFLLEAIILFFGFLALFWAVKIGLDFDINITSNYQYSLATKSYLVAVIISFILVLKLPLFMYFIWSMDYLSNFIKGAMCAVGIISGSKFGVNMLFLKLINLVLLCAWLFLNHHDNKSITSAFMKPKFYFFQVIYFSLCLEFILQVSHFKIIFSKTLLSCCSTLFNQSDALAFYQQNGYILSFLFCSFALLCLARVLKKELFFTLCNLVFMISLIYALIRVFSPYIYELPTHMCPFCMLGSEYNFIGYLIYILAFISIVSSVFVLQLKLLAQSKNIKLFNLVLILNFIVLMILLSFVGIYYVKNGVLF